MARILLVYCWVEIIFYGMFATCATTGVCIKVDQHRQGVVGSGGHKVKNDSKLNALSNAPNMKNRRNLPVERVQNFKRIEFEIIL